MVVLLTKSFSMPPDCVSSVNNSWYLSSFSLYSYSLSRTVSENLFIEHSHSLNEKNSHQKEPADTSHITVTTCELCVLQFSSFFSCSNCNEIENSNWWFFFITFYLFIKLPPRVQINANFFLQWTSLSAVSKLTTIDFHFD